MNFLTLLFITFFFHNLQAEYRYVIYTDQEDESAAQEVISTFRQTEPFNEFEVEFEIRQLSTEELGCSRPYEAVPRVIECDTLGILQRTFNDGFDQAMVVSDSDSWGGAAGSVPVMSSSNPSSTMIHEYMHTLGFCDEYEFTTEDEANIYCTPQRFSNYLNATIIEPLDGGYTGDDHARSVHSGDIPWYSTILPTTAIANQSLGTPASTQEQLGLYESRTCMRATEHSFHLWKPGNATNIMQDLNFSIGAYVPLVREAMESVVNPPPPSAQPQKGTFNRTMLNSSRPCFQGSGDGTTPLTHEEQLMLKNIVIELNLKGGQ